MFKLEKNDFLNSGKCWYRDEHGNTVFMLRKENQFTAKIRFNNNLVTAKPLIVNVPPVNEDGASLQMDFPEGALEKEDIKSGIEGFTTLVQHWIDMLYDIKLLECNNKWLQNQNPGASEEDVNEYKIQRLIENEELSPMISKIFGNLQK